MSQLPKPDPVRTAEVVLGHTATATALSPTLTNLLSRDPFLAQTAEEVATAFREEGIAFARAASLKTTVRVQEIIGGLMEAGTPSLEGAEIISEATAWTRGYAETAYRTSAMSAYVGGTIDTQMKPFISSIFIGFEVIGSNDADTRRGRPEDRGEHHKAALGLVAETMDPVWNTTTPPYGFNCRHLLRQISRFEAHDKGWLDENGRMPIRKPATFQDFSPKAGFGIKPSFRA